MVYPSEPFLKLLYVTPERIVKAPQTRQILQELYQNEMLARFIIDEAHCVSSWGHDFRKDYAALSVLKVEFPEAPIVALTATARMKVIEDIVDILRIPHCKRFHTGFDRPNLYFRVTKKPQSIGKHLLTPHNDIVCLTVCCRVHPRIHANIHSRTLQWSDRDCVLHDEEGLRGHGGLSARHGHQRRLLPCWTGQGGAKDRAIRLVAREDQGGLCDDSLRHGHQHAHGEVRHSPLAGQVLGRILSGTPRVQLWVCSHPCRRKLGELEGMASTASACCTTTERMSISWRGSWPNHQRDGYPPKTETCKTLSLIIALY